MNKKKIFFGFYISLLLNFFLYPDIFYKVSGRLEYQGKGIGNIVLEAIDLTELKKIKNSHSTKTDRNGNFSFFLDRGEYAIQMDRWHPVYHIAEKYSELIAVTNKNISGIKIQLEKVCTISGKVQFDDGSPVNFHIRIDIDHSEDYFVKKGDSGSFKIFAVRSGNQQLTVSPRGIIGDKVIDFTLVPGENKEIDVIFPKRISIQGRAILGENTKSFERVALQIFSLNENAEIIGGTVLRVSPDGSFTFYNLKPGLYSLQARSAGVALSTVRTFRLIENETKQIDIQLE